MSQEPFRNFESSLIMKFDRDVSIALDSYQYSNRMMIMFHDMSRLKEFLDEATAFAEKIFKTSEEEGAYTLYTTVTEPDKEGDRVVLDDTSHFSTERDRDLAQQLAIAVADVSYAGTILGTNAVGHWDGSSQKFSKKGQ